MRVGAASSEVEDEDRNRLGGVAGRLERREPDAAEFDRLAIVQRLKWILGRCRRSQVNRRASAIAQFEMAGDEIGVEMSKDHMSDAQAVRVGEGQILPDVALRVDDSGAARRFVADEIRGVRKTIQIKLVQDHRLD